MKKVCKLFSAAAVNLGFTSEALNMTALFNAHKKKLLTEIINKIGDTLPRPGH